MPSSGPDPDDRRVGMIGLGLMGTAMAGRFLSAGYRVVGYDVDPSRTTDLGLRGGTAADGSRAVAESCRRVVLSLPGTPQVRAVLGEVLPVLRPGQVVIDTTTGAPEFAPEAAERLARLGVIYLDASVSGSSAQVASNEATVIAGGDAAGFEGSRDLFDLVARRAYWLGPAGSGLRMKLVSNLVLGLNRAALAEALALARALGLDLARTLEVLRDSAAASRVMDTKGEKMVRGDFSVQARLSQHHKDVRLMLGAAERAGVALPLSVAHERVLDAAETAGLGGLDNSAIFAAYGHPAADGADPGRGGGPGPPPLSGTGPESSET